MSGRLAMREALAIKGKAYTEGDEESFTHFVQAGGKVDVGDWMPDEYRYEAIRMMSFQAVNEIFPLAQLGEWLPKLPSFHRKRIYFAKLQDEVGHGMYILRCIEGLGKSRWEVINEYLSGKIKLLSTFHYGYEFLEEMPIHLMLQNSQAIVQFRSLMTGSYQPYAVHLRRLQLREESFHHYQSVHWIHTLMNEGSPRTRRRLQDALDRWWYRSLTYFGPRDSDSVHTDKLLRWRLKPHTNDEIRQRWLSYIVPLLQRLGLTVPDPALEQDPETGRWRYTEPDWQEFWRVVRNGGPRYAEFMSWCREAFERDSWVRRLIGAGVNS
jgi:ring-1,2-phenylacetyl-CoA epoxidase subunit PaaA